MKKKQLKQLSRTKNKTKPTPSTSSPALTVQPVVEVSNVVEFFPKVEMVAVQASVVETVTASQPRPSRPMRSLSDLIRSELSEYERKLSEMEGQSYQKKVTKYSEKAA